MDNTAWLIVIWICDMWPVAGTLTSSLGSFFSLFSRLKYQMQIGRLCRFDRGPGTTHCNVIASGSKKQIVMRPRYLFVYQVRDFVAFSTSAEVEGSLKESAPPPLDIILPLVLLTVFLIILVIWR